MTEFPHARAVARVVAQLSVVGVVGGLLAGPLAGSALAAGHRTALPNPIVVSPTSPYTNATTVSVSYTPSAKGHYNCFWDGVSASCPSTPDAGGTTRTVTSPSLADGTHTFVLKAIGQGKAGTFQHSWTVDTVKPQSPAIDPMPASMTNHSYFDVYFSDSDMHPLTYLCSVDGKAASGCISPLRLTGLADGGHSVAVTAVDEAGNLSTAASATWTVDTTAPASVDVVPPPRWTNSTSVSVNFTVPSDASGAVCSIDGAAAVPCGTPFTASGLAEGDHSLTITAVDSAGNLGTGVTVVWTVDRTPPLAPTIETGPTNPTDQTDARFVVANQDPTAALLCSLDGAVFDYCPAGFSYSGLADGAHTFRVLAVDEAGNRSAAATYPWSIQPTGTYGAQFDSGPSDPSADVTPDFLFHDTAPDNVPTTFRCRLDANDWFTCTDTGAVTVTLTSQGVQSFQVEVSADGGTTWGAPATWTWTYAVTAASGSGGSSSGQASAVTSALRAPTTLTGPAVVTFSANVTGVSPATVLLATGTTTVPTRQACRDAAGVSASCSGPVRSVVLTPVHALVPGQHYVVVVSGPKDAGGGLVAGHLAFRGVRVLQEVNAATSYRWRTIADSRAYGRSYVTDHLAGSSVSYRFRGTSVTWFTVTGPAQGQAYVYIDGVRKATVNDYAATAHFKVARSVAHLADRAHILRIVVAGRKGAKAATGTRVVVDAVRVGRTLHATPTLAVTPWLVSARAAFGHRYAVIDQRGQSVTFRFRGTSVAWSTVVGPAMGKVAVYVDGARKAVVDNYSAHVKYGVGRLVRRLSDRVHTLKIVVLGTRHVGATGTRLAVDRFSVG